MIFYISKWTNKTKLAILNCCDCCPLMMIMNNIYNLSANAICMRTYFLFIVAIALAIVVLENIIQLFFSLYLFYIFKSKWIFIRVCIAVWPFSIDANNLLLLFKWYVVSLPCLSSSVSNDQIRNHFSSFIHLVGIGEARSIFKWASERASHLLWNQYKNCSFEAISSGLLVFFPSFSSSVYLIVMCIFWLCVCVFVCEREREKEWTKRALNSHAQLQWPNMEMAWRLIIMLKSTKRKKPFDFISTMKIVVHIYFWRIQSNPINQVIAFYFEPHHLRAHFENDS